MPTFTAERWRQISPYLDEVLDLPESDRLRWLESLRLREPQLADLLAELLQEQNVLHRQNFLERTPGLEVVNSPSAGRKFAAYTLVSPIGEGGMGTVWLAERSDGRFQRRVAIKLLRFSVATQGAAERFKREGMILGQLEHPHIAELIDAGVTPNGEPYLVLEYVEGDPIDQYCDQHQLSLVDRIRLFLDVLGAVAHAHANLIVHRDLKPSNVLVRHDAQVKLLDFGIAKLLTADASASGSPTVLTQEGGGAFTPQFAAPEQVTGSAVTTGTDVYALGVLLFLILTGQHPAGPGPHSPAELVKAITETDPPMPSEVIAKADAKVITETRRTTTDRLRRQLRGDLDTIVSKALKKDVHERYASVATFAEDLSRYLKHEPISTRPDALLYRARKYIRRHRWGVAIGAALLLLLATFSVIQAVALRRITRERDRADRIAQFMTNIFKVADPGHALGNTLTARDLLDTAAREIDTGLARDPELQARLLYVMALAYNNLGLYPRAQALLERDVEISNSALGPDNVGTLRARQKLAWSLFQQGRFAEAEAQQRSLIAVERRVLGPEHGETIGSMGDLATTLSEEHRLPESEKLQREVLEIQKRTLGPTAQYTLASMDNLAITLLYEGRVDEAEKLERQTLDIHRNLHGPENLTTIHYMMNLAEIKVAQGSLGEAEKMSNELLQLEGRLMGPDSPEAAETTYSLAVIKMKQGNRDQALALLSRAVDHGLLPREAIAIGQDPEFKALAADPRFAALVQHAKLVASRRLPSPK